MRNLEQGQRTSFPEFMYLYDVSQFLSSYTVSSSSRWYVYHDQAFNDCNRSIQCYCQSRSSHRKVQTFGITNNQCRLSRRSRSSSYAPKKGAPPCSSSHCATPATRSQRWRPSASACLSTNVVFLVDQGAVHMHQRKEDTHVQARIALRSLRPLGAGNPGLRPLYQLISSFS